MSLSAGTRLGPYVIEAPLGAGGMGEVYRARDSRLNRDVALKILPEAFSSDPGRLARFSREAQLLASLNHPNIGAIYGLEEGLAEHDSPTHVTAGVNRPVRALVLELVEGRTLADQIARGPIPPEEGLAIARQIADALEAAHEHGVIHRDLKPANIKVKPDGTVKVLDFGLAKAMESGGRDVNGGGGAGTVTGLSQSPTLSMQATQAGIILGTAAYMSPEQAAGKPVDKRSDLWAFGVVLLEMLTGRPTFTGETVSHVLASVLKSDPDWSGLPPETPPAIRKLLGRCLEKDRRRRLDSAGVARFEIEDALAHRGETAAVAPSVPNQRVSWTILGALLMGALAASLVTWTLLRPAPEAPRMPSRFTITTRAQPLRTNQFDRNIVLSPDGQRLVYVAEQGTGTGGRLMVRDVGELEVTPLSVTTARAPFFSDDSQWVGYFDNTELMKTSVTGGPALVICAYNGAPRGASWADDGTVIFATSDPKTGLWRVPSGGGDPTLLTTPDASKGEGDHLFPSVLPAGRGVIFTVEAPAQIDRSEIAVLDWKTNQRRTLVRGGSQAQYVETGHLVYAAAGTLRAVRFDLETLQVLSDPVPVVAQVRAASTGAANFTVSRTGTLAYVPGNPVMQRSLVWIDRAGREEPVMVPPRAYGIARLSPSGMQVAVDVRDDEEDIWILDLRRGTTPRRLTYGPSTETNPLWVSDTHLVYTSNRSGRSALYRQAVDGTGTAEQLTESGDGKFATSLTPDGSGIVGHQDGPFSYDVVLFPIAKAAGSLDPDKSNSAPKTAQELVKTRYFEHNAELSPNGRFLVYQSNESGPFQIIVRPFPGVDSGTWTVSTGSGSLPAWARSGTELFYLTTNALMAVPVDTSGSTFAWGSPVKLFDFQNTVGVNRSYDISPDGRRFLVVKGDVNREGVDIVVVLDWSEELKAKAPSQPKK